MAHCVRHRALDQLLLAAVGDGFRQVVVIGAGYDMRAFRFRSALAGVRWIELDEAGTQERKRRRLARLGASQSIGYAATDLEREPLGAALARAGFDPEQPTCYLLEGLVHYLSTPALAALFAGLGRPGQRARILLSFIAAEMRARASNTLLALFRLMGERPRSLLEAQALAALLAGHGYRDLRLWTFPEQLRDFVPAAVHARRRLRARWWQTIAQANRER
jgi:methyltransferase (TIGR00027 family)